MVTLQTAHQASVSSVINCVSIQDFVKIPINVSTYLILFSVFRKTMRLMERFFCSISSKN